MAKKKDKASLGIYIHIPFCRSKCDYCDFYSIAGGDKGLMDRYQGALLAHLKETAPRAAEHRVDTIYIGGGTPSFYGEKRIRGLLKCVFKYYDVAKDCEITMEGNPDSVDRKVFARLRRAGVNRFSLGAQSACDKDLECIHRPHTFQQTREAVEAARKAKVTNLSLDLIYGLPGQSLGSWQETVEQVLALEPEHLSCYGLKVEEGTPLWQRRETEDLPDDDAQADMYLWTVDRLEKAGYRQYEISNFAKTGLESRHNMRYWRLQEYVGFGPAAHSDFGDWRYSYIRDVNGYIEGVQKDGELIAESERIPARDRGGEYLMLGLRTVEGVEEAEYRRRFLMDFTPLEEKLCQYREQGWAVKERGRWHFTPEGFLRSNLLIGDLLELQEEATLESVLKYNRRRLDRQGEVHLEELERRHCEELAAAIHTDVRLREALGLPRSPEQVCMPEEFWQEASRRLEAHCAKGFAVLEGWQVVGMLWFAVGGTEEGRCGGWLASERWGWRIGTRAFAQLVDQAGAMGCRRLTGSGKAGETAARCLWRGQGAVFAEKDSGNWETVLELEEKQEKI